MRRFYVKRKDFSQFPFQFYIDRNGDERPLEKGYTFTFSIEPPKDQFAFLHVHILQDFALQLDQSWDISQANLIRVAAKAFEAWLRNEPIPEDHFNNFDLLRVDANWYPHGPDGVPTLVANPYNFEVSTNEPWSPLAEVKTDSIVNDAAYHAETIDQASSSRTKKNFVFAFTTDVCPSLLFIGYDQVRNRVAQAALDIEVRLSNLADLPQDIHTLFVPTELVQSARQAAPQAHIIALEKLINNPIYDVVIESLEYEMALEEGTEQEKTEA